jgi:hypothetical protein|tara:strand:+ start:2406 stop:3764 length:1359 start_codon:yes stop_codon:yes gene_type:complete
MGVESKIRELLEGKLQDDAVAVIDEQIAGDQQPPMQGGSSKANLPTSSADAHRPLDKKQGDATPPLQGNSNPNPEQQDLSGTNNPEGGLTSEVGKAASAKAGSAPRPQHSGAGKAPNFNDGADPKSVVNQSSSKGNVHQEEEEVELEDDQEVLDEVEETEEEAIVEDEFVDEGLEELEEVEESDEEEVVAEETEEEVEETEDEVEAETLFEDDIANLFEDEEHLSEEFKTKAASLFESVVVARVNEQILKIENELVEEASKAFDEAKENLVENVDKYLSYVTEQWMKENELAIENGLRSEITESFIKGMKDVFVEHYIDIPDEKVDVLANQQQEIDELKSKLDEEINKSIAISEEKEQLQKARVFSSVVDDLAETEVEKFATLVDGLEFGNEEQYAEKLNVIKENYFPKEKSSSDSDKLDDSVDQGALVENTVMARYADSISKAAKFDKVKS